MCPGRGAEHGGARSEELEDGPPGAGEDGPHGGARDLLHQPPAGPGAGRPRPELLLRQPSAGSLPRLRRGEWGEGGGGQTAASCLQRGEWLMPVVTWEIRTPGLHQNDVIRPNTKYGQGSSKAFQIQSAL